MNYLVIAENDESQWNDRTGEYYHFPSKYRNRLTEGSKVIYYKGTRKKKNYIRLLDGPHYFGIATIGKIEKDLSENSKNFFYAYINNYQPFTYAVDFKDDNGDYLEKVIHKNHFWNGVRLIDKKIYEKILLKADLLKDQSYINESSNENLSSFGIEGKKIGRYTTIYERDPKLRSRAIEIHGTTCKCCRFNFEKSYGDLGKNFIHVHHIRPISESGENLVNPETDLIVVCPNCHYMIHRRRNYTLSIEELKHILLHQIDYRD
ncbi:HNH endonuclease [uncultured Chryseobacterium sp.]|uniref:HNH endonuclease n=1 Tax=uncultured Chryseobacterium sp. TaxID=259322 RepID=UPI0037495AF9